MKLLPQEYLKAGNSLDDLKNNHGVDYSITNGKIILSYNQINASTQDKLASQCRGLILRENTFEVVACPFFRFLNYEEQQDIAIDWNSAVAYDKLDGTLIISYFDDVQDKWCVATRRKAEADVEIDGCANLTFTKLFDLAINHKTDKKYTNLQEFMEPFGPNSKDFTFCFELTSPLNIVVVNYEKPDIYLLGARNKLTLKEHPIHEWSHVVDHFGNMFPKTYSFSNVVDLVELVKEFNPRDNEGIVVCDSNFNRVKIKSPAYVAYNNLFFSLTSYKNCLKLVILEKDDDVMTMVSDLIKARLTRVKQAYSKLLHGIEEKYNEIKGIENQKEFAFAASVTPYSAPLFALRAKKAESVRDYFYSNTADSRLKVVMSQLQKIDGELFED